MSEPFMHAFLHPAPPHGGITAAPFSGGQMCVCGLVQVSIRLLPTFLCAGSQQINNVLVLPNDLHHLHL